MTSKPLPNPARIARSAKSVRGQTLVEYALILSFVSVVAISVLVSMGRGVKGAFTTISSQLAIANTGQAAQAPSSF